MKEDILTNAKQLAGTKIGISRDLIPEEYKKQKFLRSQLKVAKEQGKEAKLKRSTLTINGETYTYEELRRKKLRKNEEIHGEWNIDINTEEGIEGEELEQPPSKKQKQVGAIIGVKGGGKTFFFPFSSLFFSF